MSNDVTLHGYPPIPNDEDQRLASFPAQSHWMGKNFPNGLSVNGQAPTVEQMYTLWYQDTDQGNAAGAMIPRTQPRTQRRPDPDATTTQQLGFDLTTKASERFPNMKLWRNNVVKAKAKNKDGSYRFVKAGLNGQGDYSGIMGPMGRRVEIELKVGKDKLSQDQEDFRAMILGCGGIYLECRDAESTLAELEILYRGEGN